MADLVLGYIRKASQPVIDIAILSAVLVFLFDRFNTTDKQREYVYAAETFQKMAMQVDKTYEMHAQGKLPDGSYMWYGRANEPFLARIIEQNAVQESLLRQIVLNTSR